MTISNQIYEPSHLVIGGETFQIVKVKKDFSRKQHALKIISIVNQNEGLGKPAIALK